MKIFVQLFILIAVLINDGYSQNDDTSILIKLGISNYNGSFGGVGGSSVSDDYWKQGGTVQLGVEQPLNKSWSFQGIFSFYFYSLADYSAWGEKANSAKNYVFDLRGNLKLNVEFYYFLFGLGIYSVNADKVYYLESTKYHSAFDVLHGAKKKTGVCGLLGTGFNFNLSKDMKVMIEMDADIRQYLGGSFSVGLNYSLSKIVSGIFNSKLKEAAN